VQGLGDARRTLPHKDRVRRGGDVIPEWSVVSPYWLERRWNAVKHSVKHRFEDLRCREGQYSPGLQVMEEQAALMALRDPDLTGTDMGA
jgi:hypothetical protein